MNNINTMKGIRIKLILFSLLMAGITCYSQSPNLISYQTVIRNGNNELVSNTTIGVRISILGGPEANVLVYQEEHTVKTNLNGLAYLTIGNGKILNGLITSIVWSKGPYFIKSETDPTGGKNYTIVVLSQMLSVPYAIYSSTAEKLTGTLPEKDPLFNGSIAKGITATDTSYWNRKLNTADTSRMLANYLKKSDAITTGGVETDPVFNGSIAKGITATDTSYWNRKLNTSDTSGMLANYRTGLNQKLNITDTTKMLVPYLRDADTTNMLANYWTSINNKLDAKDTTLMLSNYLKKSEAVTSGGIETDPLYNGSIAKGITSTDTSYWNRKLNSADTSGMLANYRTGLNQKLNITDTAKMLVPYLRDADTSNMLTNYWTSINNKLDAKDTTLMLSNYLKKSEAVTSGGIETDPLFNGSIAKGITATDTSYWNKKLNSTDTSRMLSNYRTSINNKLDTKDTILMLSNYLKKSEGIIETDPLFKGSIAKGITAIDTSNWNRKLSVSDTVGMLDDIQNKLDTTIRNIYNKLESKIDTNLLSSGTVKGNIQYWDGQKWIVLDPGKNGQNLQLVDGSPKWNGPSFAEIVLDSITAKEETKYSFVTAWGKVINDGGKPVSNRGIIYGLKENITLDDSLVFSGLGTGNFSVKIYNLTESSKYYFRIFASNEQGTNLSNIISFSTSAFTCGSSKVLDNNYSYEYETVNIGNQCWMKENLNTGKYRNGDNILQVGAASQEWRNLFNGTSGFVNENGSTLYNGYAVLNSKGICPKGWHIPSNNEWSILADFLGGSSIAGKKMKKKDSWQNFSNATNESNFSAIVTGFKVAPQGYHYYYSSGGSINGSAATFWSSSSSGSDLIGWALWDNLISFNPGNALLNEGHSIRCIKD